MKPFVLTYLFLMCITCCFSQEVSQLHQYFNMNPLIKRDPLFQEVQNNIQDHMTRTEPGFNEGISEKILSDLRKNIKGISAEVSFDRSNDKMKFSGKGIVTIDTSFVVDGDIQNVIDSITYYLVHKQLSGFLERTLKTPIRNASPTSELKFFVLGRLAEGLTGNHYVGTETAAALINEILAVFDREVKDYLKLIKQDQRFLGDLNPILSGEVNAFMNSEISSFLEARKQQLYQYLNSIESELDDFKERVTEPLIAANTGISVSSDEGNLGGGLYAALTTGKSSSGRQLEIGAYINGAGEVYKGEIGSDSIDTQTEVGTDTTIFVNDNIKQPFLAGVAFKFQFNPQWQFNALMTYHLISGEQVAKQASLEIGGGFIYNTQGNLIIGLAGFYQFLDHEIIESGMETNVKANSVWSVGLTFQNTVPGSPMIMIGVTSEANQSKPLPSIQISYPISLN